MGAGASAGEGVTHDMLVYQAKCSEQAERYEDMFEEIKQLILLSKKCLTVEERNLASVAAKNVVGSRRAGYRILKAIEKAQVPAKTEAGFNPQELIAAKL